MTDKQKKEKLVEIIENEFWSEDELTFQTLAQAILSWMKEEGFVRLEDVEVDVEALQSIIALAILPSLNVPSGTDITPGIRMIAKAIASSKDKILRIKEG